MRLGLTLAFLCACNAEVVAQATTQGLRVEVRHLGSGRPRPGAVVTVLDSSNLRLAQRVTDADGVAEFALPSGRLVRVRAEQVGAASVTSDALRVGEHGEAVQLLLSDRHARLAAIAVRGRQRCDRATSDGVRASAVWDEARKALEASVVASADSSASHTPVTMTRYLRRLSLRLRVEHEEVTGGRTRGAAFRSADPALLSRAGWVHDSGSSQVLFAPDAAALLSDAFAADHCFRLERRTAGDAVSLGLRFEPALGRTLSDVSGALWLDAFSGELRYLEYRYVNIPDSLNHRLARGRVEFSRLADGRWIVSRWYIRSPRLALVGATRLGMLETPRRMEVIGLQEEGGVAHVPARLPTQLLPPTVAGAVYDSTSGRALSGALVSLEGTAAIDTTDASGRFVLRPMLPGSYRLRVAHPRFQRLGMGELTDSLDLAAGTARQRMLALPSVETLARARCPGGQRSAERPLWMVGLLADSTTGLSIPGAVISVGWFDARVARHGTMVLARGDSAVVESESDERGHFLVCGLPREHTLQMTASGRGRLARIRIPASLEASGLTVHGDLLDVSLVAGIARQRGVAHFPATTLSEVRVEGRAPERARLAGFERRRSDGAGGHFIDRALLARREASRLSDVLRGMAPGVQLQRIASGGFALVSSRSAGSADPRRPLPCYLQLFVDGVKRFGQSMALGGLAPPNIDQDQVSELAAIELYGGAASTPPDFSGRDAVCGTLVLWTRER